MSNTILITGAGGSAAHNFIDSLNISSAKYTTVGVDVHEKHLSLSNADHKYLVPPNSNVTKYINKINLLVDKHNVDLVHPQPDSEVAFFAKHKNKINAPTFLPRKKTVQKCQDKILAVELFSKSDVPVAESFLIKSKKGLKNTFNKLIKKHDRLWIRAVRGAGSKGALPIVDVAHAEFWIDYWKKNKGIGYGDFMLSEFLPGKEFAFQSVWDNGKLLVSQARERQEYVFANLTASGQSSSPAVAMTVHREDVNEIATNAVRAIDPKATGIFCVDLKENSLGIPCVIEINPGRFFTTSNFFSHAGCNMPDFYVKLALKKKLPKFKPYNNLKKGLYWVRIIDMGYKLIDPNNK